jgi:hypothetical protein
MFRKILGALALVGGGWYVFGRKANDTPAGGGDPPTPAGFDAIPGTGIVELEGVGKTRFFYPDVTQTALENLTTSYISEMFPGKPLIGEFAILAIPSTKTDPQGGTIPAIAPPGLRVMDWIISSTDAGYYVMSVARQGAGPWEQVSGNNGMIAVKESDLTSPDIVNDWAILAVPHQFPVSWLALSTPDLQTQLAAG